VQSGGGIQWRCAVLIRHIYIHIGPKLALGWSNDAVWCEVSVRGGGLGGGGSGGELGGGEGPAHPMAVARARAVAVTVTVMGLSSIFFAVYTIHY